MQGGETDGLKESNRYQCDVDGLGLEKHFRCFIRKSIKKRIFKCSIQFNSEFFISTFPHFLVFTIGDVKKK